MGRKIKDEVEWQARRRLAYLRIKAQAKYRNEPFSLTIEDWREFYPTEESMAQKGRLGKSMVLTRYDYEQGWTRANTIKVCRKICMRAMHNRRMNLEYQHLFKDAEWLK